MRCVEREVGDVAHDAGQSVVLGCVDPGDAHRSSCARSASGMMPPTTTGASTPGFPQLHAGSRAPGRGASPDRIESPTMSTSSSRAAAAISAGREPDALVDDLHAGVAGRDRDLLGAVRVAVEAGLADEQPDRAAGRRPRPAARWPGPACISSPGRTATAPTPVGARYSPNTSRSAPAHSPTVPPARASAIVAGTRFSVVAATARRCASARVDRGLVARRRATPRSPRPARARPRDRW